MPADSGERDNEAARQAFGETAVPTPPLAPPPSTPPLPPYPSGPLGAAPPTVPDHALSGWWRRAGALLLDGLVSGLLAYAASFAIGFAIGFSLEQMGTAVDAESDGWVIASAVVSLIVSFLYAPLLMARGGARNGQTVGKQALGIRVVRTTGEPVTFWHGVLRQFVAQTLLMLVTLYVWALFDYLWPLGDKRNQALHDKIAKTLVLRADGAVRPTAPPTAPPSGWHAPEAPAAGGWQPPERQPAPGWLPPQPGA